MKKNIFTSKTIGLTLLLFIPVLQALQTFDFAGFLLLPFTQQVIASIGLLGILTRVFISNPASFPGLQKWMAYIIVGTSFLDVLAAEILKLPTHASILQIAIAAILAYVQSEGSITMGTGNARASISTAQKDTWIYKHRIIIVICAAFAIGLLSIELFTKDKPVKETVRVNSTTLQYETVE